MSAQTLVYLYNQRQPVVLLDLAARGRGGYEAVYAKTMTINRGVDNVLEFAFINQEQKPVNIQGKQITCRILNYTGTEILIQKTLTPVLPITGITSLRLSRAEIEDIPAQYCFYSLEIPVDTFDYPVFVDADGGARGKINIVNSVLPSFVASQLITVPTTQPPPRLNEPRTYYSSMVNTRHSSVSSFQVFFTKFTGEIQWEGSTEQAFTTAYYPIGPRETYTDYTGTGGWTLQGFHPFIRLQIVNQGTMPSAPNGDLQGNVDRIYYR